MPGAAEKIQEIFHAALAFALVNERDVFLDRICAETPLLRTRIVRLLSSHDNAVDFLEQSPTMSIGESGPVAENAETVAHQPASRSDRSSPDRLPRQFGDYELLEKIAQGGMGIVFRARQTSLSRIVAIKMILSGHFAGPDEVKRFYIEAEAAGKLDHPGIVHVFEVGCFKDQHFFSMAFVKGQSLSARIRKGPLPPREAASMAKKIADAIQAAHDQGIVHRDLKPGNVLLDDHSQPRITDFGLAKRVEEDSGLTTTGMVLGTPGFMPPEQAAGKEIDAGADVYSIGAILYAMLTGRPPFEGKSQLETILKVIESEPIALREVDRKIPKDLEAISLKCLEKEPANRYVSATELSRDLARYLAGEPIRAKNDWRRRIRKWTIREPVLAAHLAATIALMTIIIFNYWLFHERGLESKHKFSLLLGNLGILAGWAVVVLGLQKAQNKLQTRSAIPFLWAALNPLFLSITLSINDPPRQSLITLYGLLIVTTCFFRRAGLVVISTTFSIIGCVLLVLLFFDESEVAHPSYLAVSLISLGVTGFLLALLTLRMKRLGEQNNS